MVHGDRLSRGALGETRTLSMYNIHTKENITVTFKRDGKYDDAALKQLNHFMRDWRADKETNMDPALIDLIWTLHKQLGSNEPVNLICGLRTARDQRKLRKKGGGQAKQPAHPRQGRRHHLPRRSGKDAAQLRADWDLPAFVKFSCSDEHGENKLMARGETGYQELAKSGPKARGMTAGSPTKEPQDVDRHVGSRVRMQRMLVGMSQEKLGEACGITFQQIQKYEKGMNRMGASRLHQIARFLQVPVEFFYEGAPSDSGRAG